MKQFLIISTAVLSLTIANGQTNVSGGIFSNTTWTKVNSPYIVTDTVVVFPGVTLTIQPGVTVKFDSLVQLEARQAKLIANGTNVDSITFTSNCVIPAPGKYSGIFINGGNMTSQFKYCNFMYSNSAVINISTGTGFYIKNSKILFNVNGVFGGGLGNGSVLDFCILTNNSAIACGTFDVIQNCTISNNHQGVSDGFTVVNCIIDSNITKGIYENTGSILNCFIRNNGIGIFGGNPVTVNNCTITNNQTGVAPFAHHTITNCVIDSNSVGIDNGSNYNSAHNYIADCQIEFNSNGINDYGSQGNGTNTFTKNIINNNDIGILLAVTIDSFYCNQICNNTIYDLKYTLPANTNCVAKNYWCTPDSASTQAVIYDAHDNVSIGIVNYMPIDSICSPSNPNSINEITQAPPLRILPNPFSTQTTLYTDRFFKDATLTVYNLYGQTIKRINNISGQTVILSRDNLPRGLYFVRLTEENPEGMETHKTIAADKLVITDN